jgi:hypothetical protein
MKKPLWLKLGLLVLAAIVAVTEFLWSGGASLNVANWTVGSWSVGLMKPSNWGVG